MKTRIFPSAMFSLIAAISLPLATHAQDAVQTPAPLPTLVQRLQSANISSTVQELVKMAEAGTDPAVIQSYVDASTIAYVPRPDEIIYMHEHGIPSTVISSMIRHGAKLREQIAQAAPQMAPAAPAPQPQAAPTYVVQQPAPTYVETPNYVYSSPNVVYVPYSGSSYYGGSYYGGGYYGGGFYPRASFDFRLPFPGFGFSHFFGHGGGFRVGGGHSGGGHFSGGFGHRR